MDIIRFTKMDRCHDQGKRRITLCVGEYRKELIGALQQLGAELKPGRAPASHMESELQEWLGFSIVESAARQTIFSGPSSIADSFTRYWYSFGGGGRFEDVGEEGCRTYDN
ncbi:unnamed protein product [Prorocentrum cordatum]|uniref:Uncharacterized protein n=1 Tax=Prorocentrum cordatum TaxID=2364126 RepID=A0ABN9R929_9DINO|nr:unnamed protein product [Polarella glacialis]